MHSGSSSRDRVRQVELSDTIRCISDKERRGAMENSMQSAFTIFFFGLTANNTFYVLLIHIFGYLLYSTLISLLLYVEAIEDVVLGTNFFAGFSTVLFIMQTLYVDSTRIDTTTDQLFYTLVTTTRSLALKLGAYVQGERCTSARVKANEMSIIRGGVESSRHPIDDCDALINTARGLLMVYTRYSFAIFGVTDPREDYKRFEFEVELAAARNVLSQICMNDEQDTTIFDGVQFEFLNVLTQLKERRVLNSGMYAELSTKLDTIAAIKDRLWMSRRPLTAPILSAIPSIMVTFYVYVLIPLTVFSSVGKFWGIFVYTIILFFYNGRNVLSDWLGSPFVENARYQPVSFSKLRNQQYLYIETMLGTRNIEQFKDKMDDEILFYE